MHLRRDVKNTRHAPVLVRALTAAALVLVPVLGLLALSPDLGQALTADAATVAVLSLDRPVNPHDAAGQSPRPTSGGEALLLGAWEETAKKSNDPKIVKDVLSALSQVTEADSDVGEAVLGKNAKQSAQRASEALKDILQAIGFLTDASLRSGSQLLASDVASLSATYAKMVSDATAKNYSQMLKDAGVAVAEANKAVNDASPYK